MLGLGLVDLKKLREVFHYFNLKEYQIVFCKRLRAPQR